VWGGLSGADEIRWRRCKYGTIREEEERGRVWIEWCFVSSTFVEEKKQLFEFPIWTNFSWTNRKIGKISKKWKLEKSKGRKMKYIQESGGK
jgi:hypothetical protein